MTNVMVAEMPKLQRISVQLLQSPAYLTFYNFVFLVCAAKDIKTVPMWLTLFCLWAGVYHLTLKLPEYIYGED